MVSDMRWLVVVVRLAIAPVLLGALSLWVGPQRSGSDLPASLGLVLLGVIHLLYWWRPWPARPLGTFAAAAGMVLTNAVLIYVVGLSQPLLWLYPALVVGAGLRAPAAAVSAGLLGLATLGLGRLVAAAVGVEHAPPTGIVPIGVVQAPALGPEHLILLSVVLAGLGMAAVRQLIAVNADLHAAKAELADLAVAAERERLARELHDLLGRTLSLVAVKAELAGRLSAKGDPSAEAELHDVQQLARLAVREVREAVTGDRTPGVAGELAAAVVALRTVGIEAGIPDIPLAVDPGHEATVAWALREAVTNVVKHSGARTCRIALETADGVTALEVVD